MDVGTQCMSDKINKWSLYKPVRLNNPAELTYNDFKSTRFGLVPPNPSTEIIEASKLEYTYLKPRGGSYNEWLRSTDFINYNHGAIPPCSSTGNLIVNLSLSEKIFIGKLNFGGGDAISMDEFLDLKALYLAFAIAYSYGGTNYITYKTATSTIETRNTTVTYDLKTDLPFSLGSSIYISKYYWVGAEKAKTGKDEPIAQRFYALPFKVASDCSGNITTEGGGLGLQFIASGIINYLSSEYVDNIKDYQNDDSPRYFRIANDGTIYIEFTVKNNGNTVSTVNLKNSSAVARPSFAKNQPAPTTGTVSIYGYAYENMRWTEFNSITVNAGATKTLRMGVDGWMAYKNGVANLCGEGLQFQCSIAISTTDGKLSPIIVNLSS